MASEAERLWAKIARGEPDQCWLWTGRMRHTFGYGVIQVKRNGRWAPTTAPRLVWEHTHGPIAKGLCVRHACDNPLCCNPAHLSLGTQADNIRDKVARGRCARGDANGSRTRPEKRPRGAAHWNTKILPGARNAIQCFALLGHKTKYIAGIFGLSADHVRSLRRYTAGRAADVR